MILSSTTSQITSSSSQGGIWPNRGANFQITDALLVSLIAIVVVFIVLIIIILVCGLFQKGIEKVEVKTHINPREENKILDEDEDAAIALLVATIDFNKEFKKDARLIKIEKIEED